MNKRHGSILYVNFAPYENTGNILDFLLSRYMYVFLFVFNFHNLGANQRGSHGLVFYNGRIITNVSLLTVPVPTALVFFLLPIRSLGFFLQLLWHSWRFRRRYGPIDIYFTVNAFTAWIGSIMKHLGLVKKTVFWVWDYYPPLHPDKIVVLMRWAYWQFDKIASTADRVVFLNRRLELLRKDIGILPQNSSHAVVGIGTDLHIQKKSNPKKITLGFIGVLKQSQGLDMVFDTAQELTQQFPGVRLVIIGSGPDEPYFRKRAALSSLPTNFYGLLPIRDPKTAKLLGQIDIGLALYVPDESNVSYYGDPSKIKDYLSFGVPVVTTDVFEFVNKIEEYAAGIVVPYGDRQRFLDAIKRIASNYRRYQTNATRFAKQYDYKKTYPMIFRD